MSETEKLLQEIIESKKKRQNQAIARAARAAASYETNEKIREKLQDEISQLERSLKEKQR